MHPRSRRRARAHGAAFYHAVERRHANFFLSELEGAAEQAEDVLQDLRSLRLQLGNIRSALDWSFGDDGDLGIAVRLAAASAPVFQNLSHLVECRSWCARALASLDETQRGTATELTLQAALGISLMFARGNSAAAGEALSRALEVATELGDLASQLCMLGRLHIFHERIGEYSVAMGHARRAVEIAEIIGEAEALSVAYSLSGISHHLSGDQRRARLELELALEKSPPSQRQLTVLYGFDHRNRSGIALARTLWLSGRADQAMALARQTIREAADLNHPVTLSIALVWSLGMHLWSGDLEAAEAALEAFTDCAHVNALGPYITASSGFRAELALQRGDTDAALGALEESLARLRAARYELLTTTFSISIARGLMLRRRFDEARDLVDTTIARCRANGERYAMPELLCVKAKIALLADKHPAGSQAVLEEASVLARHQGALAWELKAALDLAELHVAAGRGEEARQLVERVRAGLHAPDLATDIKRAGALRISSGR